MRFHQIRESTLDLDYIESSRDYHHGQHDLTLTAKVNKKNVGKIDYSVYEGDPQIQMIDVPPNMRGKGIGSALLYKLQSMFPEKEIDWGSLTADGAALYDTINFVKKPSEWVDEFNEITQTQLKCDKLEKFIADNWIEGEQVPEKVSRAMEEFYDLEHDISNMKHHLYGKTPYIKIMTPVGN